MTDYTVRSARPDDVSGICRVAERAWRTAYGDILAAETIDAALAEWYDPDGTQSYVENDAVGYFVAEGETGIVGYASGGPTDEDGVASLGAIYVDPDHCREGIGSALLGSFEAFCRDRGYDIIRVRVLEANDTARAFYRAYDFQRVETRDLDLFGETVTEVVMRRSLA